jgi:aryl-alcohol dehydrogenase-like predicted oxidoreductase
MISELSYGAARGAVKEPDRFVASVLAAVEAGINFIDTAPGYEGGESEKLLGKTLKGNDQVLIETKYNPYEGFSPHASYIGSPQKLIQSVEESLRRLQREHIDVLLGHGLRSLETFDQFMSYGCYDAMVNLTKQGKVRYIGISELSEADGNHRILQKAVPTGAFDVVMVTINILLQTAVSSVLPLCGASDVGTVVMMPLNQSSVRGLTGVATAHEAVRRLVEQNNLPAEYPYTSPELFDFLKPYSVPEAALRYVLANPVGSCCIGTLSSERLKENLRAMDPPYLNEGRLQRLRELFGGIAHQVR